MTQPFRPQGAPPLWRLGEGAAPAGTHVALVPGWQAPLLPLALPEKLRGAARERVAERQLVELISTPADGFEMQRFAPKGTNSFDRVLLADARLAADWRKGLSPGCQALLPDYLALPAAAGLWALEFDGSILRARLGPGDGFAAEPELALALLAGADPPKAVLRLGAADAALDRFLDGLGVPVLDDPGQLRKSGFVPMRWADATAGVDLKDPPRAVHDRLRAKLVRWRLAVIAAGLALAAWLGAVAMDIQRYRAQAARDQAHTTELVREYFVPGGPILDTRAQVAAAVETALTPVAAQVRTIPPLAQFQIAAPVLTADALRLLAVAYRSDTGLTATVEAGDFATLDRLVADLQAAEFLVEQLDSRAQQTGGVVAQLRLELFE